jgi:hypothetical protein
MDGEDERGTASRARVGLTHAKILKKADLRPYPSSTVMHPTLLRG